MYNWYHFSLVGISFFIFPILYSMNKLFYDFFSSVFRILVTWSNDLHIYYWKNHLSCQLCNVPFYINVTFPQFVAVSFPIWFFPIFIFSWSPAQNFMNIVLILLCQLSEEGPCEEISSDGQSSSFNEWILPAKEFDGMWERLVLGSSLCFSSTSSILLLFFL